MISAVLKSMSVRQIAQHSSDYFSNLPRDARIEFIKHFNAASAKDVPPIGFERDLGGD